MQLVIAEKPSVAQSIASVLGARGKQDGYQEGNGYIVSWCFGHLAGLADASVYDAKYAKSILWYATAYGLRYANATDGSFCYN